ncbi:ZIP family metal transporter [Nocardia amamiensis]|uniref:ZIP family metal transporter n=1 Tax=Nocardia amamiensis TaxID=404578 RepID=A0ABS0CR65_9NOCA|nr:ZIP family metal transporter [Nocardia amamiensis]MBF6299109.1 ZIP family metal transporter [Nocardia amamiensis]
MSEARAQPSSRLPGWVSLAGAALLIAVALAALGLLGSRALPERTGPPVEEIAVEHTVLRPGEIELRVRNTGPDPVTIAQVFVNDAYVDLHGGEAPIDRLDTATLTLRYPWIDGQPYLVSMLTSTGLVIEHEIPLAVETPRPGTRFFATMALLGTYVGVIPVLLGMLLLPVIRQAGPSVLRVLLAVTVGLLVFLAVEGSLEGLELAGGAGAFGGAELVILGAVAAFGVLTAVDRYLTTRRAQTSDEGRSGLRLASMIAAGIGLHNLGEGLAIGSAYAVGELALGAFLVIGFALHNTTEGIAIVAPLVRARPRLSTLVILGVIAGAPAILGAVIGASINNTELSALLLGVGVGAIAQVVVQIAPSLRTDGNRLHPATIGGILGGIAIMYLTGLLITV